MLDHVLRTRMFVDQRKRVYPKHAQSTWTGPNSRLCAFQNEAHRTRNGKKYPDESLALSPPYCAQTCAPGEYSHTISMLRLARTSRQLVSIC